MVALTHRQYMSEEVDGGAWQKDGGAAPPSLYMVGRTLGRLQKQIILHLLRNVKIPNFVVKRT